MLKRTIVILLVISLALTFPAANSFAAQTLCELIGIGDLSANKIIILDGAEGTSAQKTVTNTQIINFGDSIGVFSNPWNTDYRISADSVRSAILNSTDLNLSDKAASTSEGYNVKYISPMGVGGGTQTVESGGVVRAEKDGAIIDVPIVTSKVLASYDGSHIGTDWFNAPSGTSLKRNVTGLAGKLVNDNAFQFTVDAGTTLKGTNPARADTRGIDTLNTPKTVVTVEFEIRVTGDAVGLVERNGGYSLMKLSADGILSYKSYDDNATIDVQVCSDASQWHDVAITYDYAADRIIYYFDGEMLPKTGNTISGADLTEIRFGLDNTTYTTGGTVCVDNLYISRGYYNPAASDVPIKTACKNGTLTASYHSPSGDRVLILALYDGNTLADIAFKPISEQGQYLVDLQYSPGSRYKAFVRESDFVTPISCFEGITDDFKSGNRVIMNCDFESSFPLSYHKNGSIIETTREDDGNTAVLFERSDVGDFHLNALSLNAQADCVAVEFDLKVLEQESMVNLMLQDADGITCCYARLLSGGTLLLGESEVSLNTDTWYRVSAIVNTYDLTIEYYLDGIKQGTGKIYDVFAASSRLNHFRIHVPPASSVSANPVKFLVDNLRIYEGTQLSEELGDVRKEIVLTGKTVFPSEEEITQKLDGYFSVHTRSGVAFANGEKTVLENKPYEKDGNTYVNAAELASVFGIGGTLSGDVTVEDFAVASGLTLTGIPNSINDGLYIFGNDSFKIPDNEEEVDKLNDYLFFQRPTPEQVTELYNASPVKGAHPRIQATADDFARIRQLAETDTYMKKWRGQIIAAADALFAVDPVIYELRDGVRLLYVSRDVMNNMYTLGMAYQLTGDKKYAERAWLDLEAVCVRFVDWHPGHDIDCAEMCAAVAIGYDWMYDAFSAEQRAAIEDGLYQKGLYEVALGFQTSNSAMSGIVTWGGQNRCLVNNGGAAMAALAVMDVYPEESAFIVSCAARAVESVVKCFAPDGAYWEGPSYWEYTIQYFAKLVSSLDSALGTNFGIEYVQGFSVTTDYELHMQTANGTYVYGDGSSARVYVPEMLWLAGKYNRKDNASVVMKKTNGNFSGGEDRALALLWYDINTGLSDIKMETHAFFEKEDTMAIRESWEDDAAYVGIHAGGSYDQLDGASFIYEADGIRWAIDPGSGNYNQTGYFDAAPDGQKWRIFYCRAESHNTIVVNPSLLPDHRLPSYSKLELVQLNDKGAIAVADTTQLLYDVSSARRGFIFTDNRKSLVVRDEVNVTKESDVYWFMQTRADVVVDETGATLTSGGKTLRLDFTSSHGATIEVGQSKPLPTSPIEENDRYGDFNRIVIKMHGSGAMNLTVKLTPNNIDATSVSDYDKSIDLWTID